jgi:hypothetical protein
MSCGGRDDVVYFAGDRLDIMGSVPVSFGADFIEHGSESDTAFLSFLQKPRSKADDFADIVVAFALDTTAGGW